MEFPRHFEAPYGTTRGSKSSLKVSDDKVLRIMGKRIDQVAQLSVAEQAAYQISNIAIETIP
jgi:hypothetical protein